MKTAYNQTCSSHASQKLKLKQNFSDDHGWAKPQSILNEYHYKRHFSDNAQNDHHMTNYGNEDLTKTVGKQTVNLSDIIRETN